MGMYSAVITTQHDVDVYLPHPVSESGTKVGGGRCGKVAAKATSASWRPISCSHCWCWGYICCQLMLQRARHTSSGSVVLVLSWCRGPSGYWGRRAVSWRSDSRVLCGSMTWQFTHRFMWRGWWLDGTYAKSSRVEIVVDLLLLVRQGHVVAAARMQSWLWLVTKPATLTYN